MNAKMLEFVILDALNTTHSVFLKGSNIQLAFFLSNYFEEISDGFMSFNNYLEEILIYN